MIFILVNLFLIFIFLIFFVVIFKKKYNILIKSSDIYFIKYYIQQNCHKENISVLKNESVIKNINEVLYSSKNKNNIMLIKNNEKIQKFYKIIEQDLEDTDFRFIQKVKNSLHPHCFLINLERSRERFEFMKIKLKNIKLSVRLVNAIDGYKSNLDIYSTNKSLGSIGLLLTYEKLLRYAIENNLAEIFILEDDIYFHKNFNSVFSKNKYLMQDKDIIFIGTSQSELPDSVNRGHFYEMNQSQYTYGTYGIILKQKFIKILYHSLRNKNIDIDILINHLYRKNNYDLKTIVFYPPFVLPEVRDSLNMGKRKLDLFLKKRKLLQFKNQFDYIEKYFKYNQIDNSKKTKKENKFCFIIPSYNNEKWIIKNIKSILYQNYTNYHIYYTNDMSNDNTLNILNDLIKEYNLKDTITIYNNSERLYQGLSRYQMYMNENIDNDDILIFLDGDDFLYDSNVLNVLNNLYNNGYLMTYGKFVYWTLENGYENIGGNKSFPIDIIKEKTYRKFPFISQHLRTVKKKIIKDIDKSNFYDWNNNIITSCTDLIESFHCLEKTDKHCNSNQILLIYNKTNSMKYSNSYYRDENKEYKQNIESYIRNNYIYNEKL